jgi:hypothetical protein
MPQPIRQDAAGIDLTPRFVRSVTVAGSPAAAAETTVATITVPGDIAQVLGIELIGWGAFTVGTSGTASTLRIRQTNTSGTVIASTGALTTAAAALFAPSVMGLDTAGVLPGQVYVLTLQVTSAAAASTFSAVYLRALVV